jgi:HlyD family secretion protein
VTDLKKDLASLQLDDEPPPSRRRWWIAAAVLVIAAAAVAFAWRTSVSLRALEVETVMPTVEREGPASAGTPVLTASGYIVARREAVVSSKIQGRLSELRVEEGSVVAENELLARLESADFVAAVERARAQVRQADASVGSAQAAVRRAEADLSEARRQLGVAERLSADRLLAVDSLDAARSRVQLAEAARGQATADAERALAGGEQARAELSVAQAQLQNTMIRAPFAGTVVRKMAEVGESVAPIPPGVNISTASGAVVALADLATLEMEADVSEANVARLQEGQPAEVTVEAFPDRRYKAVLRQIIPTADRTKATVLTKVTLLDKDKDLKPEMSAKVTFLAPDEGPQPAEGTPAKPVILVPSSAVVTREGGTRVFEIVEGRARLRPVTTAGTRRGLVVVSDGLAGSETLVAQPADSLADGQSVRTRAAAEGAR